MCIIYICFIKLCIKQFTYCSLKKRAVFILFICKCIPLILNTNYYYFLLFRQLKTLFLYDLPEVENREQCISALEKNLPFCKVDFPVVVES